MATLQPPTVQSGAMRTWTLPTTTANATNPFAVTLAQYPILEVLVSHLHPDDVLALSILSQVTRGLVRMHDANAKANLLTKTLCPSMGIAGRVALHCPCTAKSFHASIKCGGRGFDIESQPCNECGINTCDECRIHVLYQVMTEDPGLNKHRWWAGYFFLGRQAIAMYPPKEEANTVWYLPADKMMPLHDQGRFHTPLDVAAIGDPEPIDRILDIDLGCHIINPSGRVSFPYSGHQMVRFLNFIANSRKQLLCSACFQEHQKQQAPKCSCTLRKRFLDRWLCVPCYLKEHESDVAINERDDVEDDNDQGHSHFCQCGTKFTPYDSPNIICNWCKGEVDKVTREYDDPNDAASSDDEEYDEDHSAADFQDLPADAFGFVKNRDDSLSVYVNGTCIRGERLGRGLITSWLANHGVELPCTCCHCGGQQHSQDHGEGVEEDNGVAEEDDDDGEEMPALFDIDVDVDGDGDERVDDDTAMEFEAAAFEVDEDEINFFEGELDENE